MRSISNVLGGASLLLLASCSTASIERRTLPVALADHVQSLPSFDPSAHVVVPEGLAWNEALARLRQIAPIARNDPAQLALQTSYAYESSTANGVRTQSRTYYDVMFTRDARRGLRAVVTPHREQRMRGVCGEATAFTPVAADGSSVANSLDSAVDALAGAPVESFVFESTPATLAASLLGSNSPYLFSLGYGPDGSPIVDAAGRESGAQRRDVTIEVRSGYRAYFDPAEGGTRVRVEATLEHRTSDEDAEGVFVPDDASRVWEGVYGTLAALTTVRDIVLPDQPRAFVLDPPSVEPAIEVPVEDYRGAFDLRIAFLADASRRRDPAFWQDLSSVFVAIAANGQSPVSPALSAYAARDWSPIPLGLSLAGDTDITVTLTSAPTSTPEQPARSIPVTTVRASQLVHACGQFCVDADGGAVCFLLTRHVP